MVSLASVKNLILNNGKLIAGVTGVVGLLTALYQLHNHVYDRGYDAAKIHFVAEQNKALDAQREAHNKEVKDIISRIQQDHQDELNRVRSEREIITKVETVTKYVDKKIIVQAECELLASDVISVLKQATDIVSTSTSPKN